MIFFYRNKVPPRPAGQRTEPEPQQGFQGFGFGDGFHMSFGIGAFPFGYFASSFNFGEPRAAGVLIVYKKKYVINTNNNIRFSLQPPTVAQYNMKMNSNYLNYSCI